MANTLVRHICPRIRVNTVHNTIVHAFKNVLATRKSSTNMVNLSERESTTDHLQHAIRGHKKLLGNILVNMFLFELPQMLYCSIT